MFVVILYHYTDHIVYRDNPLYNQIWLYGYHNFGIDIADK